MQEVPVARMDVVRGLPLAVRLVATVTGGSRPLVIRVAHPDGTTTQLPIRPDDAESVADEGLVRIDRLIVIEVQGATAEGSVLDISLASVVQVDGDAAADEPAQPPVPLEKGSVTLVVREAHL